MNGTGTKEIKMEDLKDLLKFKVKGQKKYTNLNYCVRPHNFQSVIWVEELSELIKAITKMERMMVSGDDIDSDEALALRKNLIEEMADVLICIKQMMIFNSIQTIELQNMINKKIERNDQRYEKPENDEYDDELDSLDDFSNIEYDDDGNVILSSLNEEQLKIMVRVREKKAQGMSLGEIIESELKEMLGIKEDE